MSIQIKKTDEIYRGQTGTTALEVDLVGGSWDELFEELMRNPKVFYEMPTSAFTAERELNEKKQKRTPSINVIQRELDRQAWNYGIVLGFKDVTDKNGKPRRDVFRLCMRTNELKDITIPKRITDLNLLAEDFGKVHR